MKLKTSFGRTIIVEDIPFAKGGEGAVHNLISPKNSNECVKLYYLKERTQNRKDKVEHMIKNLPPNLNSYNHVVCWAKEAVFQGNNFVGFIMPLAFSGSIQLYELCTKKMKAKLPQKWKLKYDRDKNGGIEARLKLCTNLASAINSVHQLKSYVLVDLKPQNVLITIDGKVSLIDCDSIQISNNGRIMFPAKVATAEYVPPEGGRINPSKNTVNQSWDRFSLAIVFYEIIFGLHPYTATFKGKYQNSTTIDLKIKGGLFVHGKKKDYVSVLPPLHKNYAIIPKQIQVLFERAFSLGHNMPDVRPTAEEWGKTLYSIIINGKSSYRPKVVSSNLPQFTKKQKTNLPQNNLPDKKVNGISAWLLFFLCIPMIGIAIVFSYSYQGNETKPILNPPGVEAGNPPFVQGEQASISLITTKEIEDKLRFYKKRDKKKVLDYFNNSADVFVYLPKSEEFDRSDSGESIKNYLYKISLNKLKVKVKSIDFDQNEKIIRLHVIEL